MLFLKRRTRRMLHTACIGGVALGVGIGGAVVSPTGAGAGASAASAQLSGPASAPLGGTVRLHLDVTGAPSLGALQGSLRYDHRAVEISRVLFAPRFASGGTTTPLTTSEAVDRTTIGAWSCSGPACGASPATAVATQRVAEIDVEPLAPGNVQIRLDGLELVNTDGSVVTAHGSTSFTLAVGRGAALWSAPIGSAYGSGRAAVAHRAASSDFDRDGAISERDPLALGAAWTHGAEASSTCATAPAGADIDGDGCLSIADIQTAAARIAVPAGSATSKLGVSPHVGPFTVNSTADGADASADGTCQTATAGQCTLRAAIQEANRAGTHVSIGFSIPGSGVHTISPASALPPLTNANGITIDGFTQPGSSANTDPLVVNAVYGIELAGKGSHAFNGFDVLAANNTIRGLVIHGFAKDLWFSGAASNHNTVIGNILGLLPNGNFDPGYGYVVSSHCVMLTAGASYNRFGAPGAANRNVISGCNHIGITMYLWGTKYNVIQNNIVGLDPTGTLNRKTLGHGVDLNSGTQSTMVGGSGAGEGNVLSGNRDEGVEISHNALTLYNSVIDNFIGADATGLAAPAYAHNGKWGIHLEGFPNCNNAACPLDAGFNTVTGNVVVGSGHGGIFVDKGVHDSVIADNLVGLTRNGTPAGNVLFGVHLEAGSVRNTVGPDNVIAYNDSGVSLRPDGLSPPNSFSSTTNANKITQNSIYANATGPVSSLGIDLTPQGVVNDATHSDPHVNDGMLAPTLSNATPSSVDAATCPGCTVEVFLSDRAQGFVGSGKTYLSFAVADGTGIAHVALPAGTAGQVVTATSTNSNNSTSEFSRNVKVPTTGINNEFPTAAFIWSCTHQDCTVDASSSRDPDGTIAGYLWNFGDGSSGSGAVVHHHFASAGVFTVALIVSDNLGGTGGVSVSVDASRVGAQGNSVFAVGHGFSVNGKYVPISGDFNGDGKSDILWYAPGAAGDSLWYATTGGVFQHGPGLSINGTYTPISGDFNGDGKSDILWYAPGAVGETLWYGATSGFVTAAHLTVNGTYTPAVGDFNGDGKDDIVWNVRLTPAQAVWYGATSGFSHHTATLVGAKGTSLVGDFNGDSYSDVLWYQAGPAREVLWNGTSHGLALASTHPKISGTYTPVAGDFNGDAKADVLWYAPGPGVDAVWYGAVSGLKAGPHVSVNGVYIAIAGDFNGDGHTDILWYAAGSHPESMWLGIG